MAIAQRFQPRNLAESRFNPFYGEMPELPRGSSIKRVSSPIQGESNTFTSDPMVPSWTGKTHNLAMVRPPVRQLEDLPPPPLYWQGGPVEFPGHEPKYGPGGFPSPGGFPGPGLWP